MLLRNLLFICLIATSLQLNAQEIKGRITNEQNVPVKYATIYIEELQTGTSANQEGIYDVKVSPGTYTMSVRSLGYSPTVKVVEVVDSDIILDIKLGLQSYILAGVTVRADDEDPAYSIMRKAIARAPGFLNQTKSYVSEVYIKFAIKFEKLPRLIAKQMETNGERPKAGETYVNESINKFTYKAPDIFEQEVISVNNSFPISEDEIPVVGVISNSIYESVDDFYLSPFAPNAFAHYNFSYEGLLQDGSWFIDKIKVTPKRKSKLLVEGYLYIVEDLWCLYSYELKMFPPYSELEIKQHYAPVRGNAYMPVNLFGTAKVKVMGVKANAVYTTTIKYKSVELNPLFANSNIKQQNISFDTTSTVESEPLASPKIVEVNEKIDQLMTNSELSNREMVELQKLMSKKASLQNKEGDENPLEIKSNYNQIIRKDALVHDSLYWDSVRTVPASDDEKISYRKVSERKAKEDSASVFKKVAMTTLFGNYEWERSKKVHMYYSGLLNIENFGFNPVDGFQVMQHFKLRWAIDSVNLFRLYGTAGYAINRASLFGKAKARLNYNGIKRGQVEIEGGYLTRDFNAVKGSNKGINAIYNLLTKQNYIKSYQDTYIKLRNKIDITNGLTTDVSVDYHQIDSVGNSTDFSFFYQNEDYAENIPENSIADSSHFASQSKFGVKVLMSYTPRQRYKISKGMKRLMHSDWPMFWVGYEGAIKLQDNQSDFHRMELGVKQRIDIYTTSEFRYNLSGGFSLSNKQVHFSSFKHFYTIEEFFTINSMNNSFALLNNYEYSTMGSYFEMHLKYSNDFLLLKRLPFISNQLWKENIYFNALLVDEKQPFYELGYSLSQIFFAGELGVFVGFKGANYHAVGVKAIFEF